MVCRLLKSVILFIYLGFFVHTGFGQQKISFNRLSVEQGLSQTSVLSVAQDSNGFIWLGTRYGLNKYDTYKVKIYKHDRDDTTSLSGNDYIGTLLCDSKGTLWVGTSHGLNRYCPATESFRQILQDSLDKNSISSNFINKVLEDNKGSVWVATRQGLNLLTDRQKLSFTRFLQNENIFTIEKGGNGEIWLGTSGGLLKLYRQKNKYLIASYKDISRYISKISENDIVALCSDGNDLWIGTTKSGLIRYNTLNRTFINYSSLFNSPIRLSSNNIRKIVLSRDRKLWIATQKGVNVLDASREKVLIYQYDADDNNSLSQNSVYDIYQDRQGIIWIGTYFGGVNFVYPENNSFEVYRNKNYTNSISSNVISAITQDKYNNLWVGTEAEGLNYYNVRDKVFTVYKNNPSDPGSLSSNLIKTVYVDHNENVWVGTHLGGLDCLNPQKKRFIHYRDTSESGSNNINYILEDSKKRFWIATGKGLKILDKETGKFSAYKIHLNKNSPVTTSIMQYIYEDSRQNIWVGGIGGIYLLKNNTGQFINFNVIEHMDLPSANITCIREDSSGNIWIGTYQGGLNLYIPSKNKFVCFTESNGLAGNSVMGILEEKPGILWLSTNNGLSRFDVAEKKFRNYNVNDGLPGNVFNLKSFFKDTSGKMYFGGFEGLVSFRPSGISINHYSPDVIFTGIKLFNKSLPASSPYSIKNNGKSGKQVNLEYSHNVFTIEFASLNYIRSQKNSYAYYLDGFEKEWNYTGQSSVTYTNLYEGTYRLLVRGRNNDGIWSNHISQLLIVIKPPLWRTWWAYLIYTLILGAILFGITRFFIIRELLKKEKEVHQMKLDFFTNVSHEIRTPLTLIVAPLEKMLANPDKPVKQSQLKFIKDNADRLIKLITELLDFRKAETGHLELKVTEEDLVTFAQHVFHYFHDSAAIRNIKYEFSGSAGAIMLFFDKEQMEKVFFNLLSNAFKFVHDGGRISMKIIEQEGSVDILIEDNGLGIPKDKQKFLFNAFFQVNPDRTGSGVGLALCRNIVELHHGEISLISRPRQGKEDGYTCVKVSLKKGTRHFKEIYPDKGQPEMPLTKAEGVGMAEKPVILPLSSERKTILVIEDNDEMRQFIAESLEEQYHILACNNGSDGAESAFTHLPDLVVSDIMMQGLDGLELCTVIKNDKRTDHIPVILLTAKADYSHQLTGVKAGADLYMVKPFSVELLHANIKNLLDSREVMKQKFSKKVMLEPANIVIDSPEEAFIQKVMNLIENNLSGNQFNIPWLAEEMGMSQPVLYKKIRALTNLSVNDFIKSIRLKKAANLLSQKIYNVSEIAYMVGFSDPKYFAKEFKKQFGKSPAHYKKETDASLE